MQWEHLFITYAMQFVGVPYKFGGMSPMEGLDCSALVRLVLRSQGIWFDTPYTSQTLYAHFSKSENHVGVTPELGALVFYGNDNKGIDHVAMCLTREQHLEAAGGDHTTLTLAQAIERRAYVKLTPIRTQHRVAIFLPHYPFKPLP